MGNLPLSLLSGLLAGEASGWARRAKRRAIFLAVVALLSLTVWALVVVAAVIWLAEDHGALAATVGVAAILAATAIVAIAIMMVMDRLRRRRVQKRTSNTAFYTTAAAIALPSLLKSKSLLLLAVAAGSALLAANFLAPGSEEGEGGGTPD